MKNLRKIAGTGAVAAVAVVAGAGCTPWAEWLNTRTCAVHDYRDHALSDPSLHSIRARAISRDAGNIWVGGAWYGFNPWSPDEVIVTVDVGPSGGPECSFEEGG